MSYLFFSDGLLFFVEAREDQINCIKEGFDRFCLASNQHVNFAKSLMFVSPNVNEHVARKMSKMLEISLTKELGGYMRPQIVHRGDYQKQHSKMI